MIRLDKYLSDSGLVSRREAKQRIREGRVRVNGQLASTGDIKIDPDTVCVELDGSRLGYRKYTYLMMNKPGGVLSATEDTRQKTVLDLLPIWYQNQGLFPVGRLDKDTTGLLLLTNDGNFAHNIIAPKKHVSKCYHARINGTITQRDIDLFQEGILLEDGLKCMPAQLQPDGDGACFVTVMEGKYHQVKRMLAALNKPVTALKRISIGELMLPDDLAEGEYRVLLQQELKSFVTSLAT